MMKRRLFMLLITYSCHIFAAPLDIANAPLFLSKAVAPLNLLIMGRDHKLYYEAYNDASDINGDGSVDVGFKPSLTYYGYFDSKKCYSYGNDVFSPISVTQTGQCSGSWSGNFLNYLTTSRIDALRKVFYGGFRQSDGNGNTVLERAYIPQDAHSWGKEYTSVANDGYAISDYTPFSQPASGTRHLFANTTLLNGNGKPLLRVARNQIYRIWEWVSIERPVAGDRVLHGGSGPSIANFIQDYTVRTKVCVSSIGLEDNCRSYANGNKKPIGLLQEYGENASMLFGLMTGSYSNNLQGGVIRKNISNFRDEVNANTGQMTNVVGIVRTIDRLKTIGFGGNYYYNQNCGWIVDRNMRNTECRMWGNPIGEMMYEGLRYFAGKANPTSSFNYSGGDDSLLGLPKPNWQSPYTNLNWCAKANFIVISDIFPSYDSDQIPGSYFNSFGGDLSPSFNAQSLGQSIFSGEGLSSFLAFIGQSGSLDDGAPTAKTITSLGNIRGLSPEEPSKQGSFYSASAAYYGWLNDINPIKGKQSINTFSVALTSPLPEIKINVGSQLVTLIPFAKSVGGWGGLNLDEGAFQPTNTIVDYYVETLTANSAVFRINFEDVQQGADHDMDAIVKYTITVNGNNTLTITLDSTYAAGGIIQHMGYVISGTTADGVYLEVRDKDTNANNDPDYFLDTPPGTSPGNGGQDNQALPLYTSRVFTPSFSQAAKILKSPLWYAAKWGGFKDKNNNNKPDLTAEFDADGDSKPDNYFLVTSALKLKELLSKAFDAIKAQSGSITSASLSSGFLNTTTKLYQAMFSTENWQGKLLSFKIDPLTGNVITSGPASHGAEWDASVLLNNKNFNTGRHILTYKPSTTSGIKFRWPQNPTSPQVHELDLSQIAALNTNPVTNGLDGLGLKRLNYLRGQKAFSQTNGGTFRNRESPLGDIINSSPLIVNTPDFPYPLAWPDGINQTTSYLTFRANQANRKSVLYVGANDGMLHAFDAATGNELFAYVPSSVYSNLSQLTNPDYTHRFYVDAPPSYADVFYANAWHTLLIGGLNAGGQGYYALDITKPSRFLETNAGQIVRWEFSDAQDADLGFSYSTPSTVRLKNGNWAAIFGNGYNNTAQDSNVSLTGNAVLYVVNVETGALIKKFDTGVGMAQDPLNTGRPNGLASPLVVDVDGDSKADYVYVGDLFGNLWKIDIRHNNPNRWKFSFKQGNAPKPLFVAQNAQGQRQAITTRPAAARVTDDFSSIQLFFGTGQYFVTTDKTNKTIQSVYGLIDDHSSTITGRGALTQQSIIAESTTRITTTLALATGKKGWYMDLILQGGQAQGERIVSNLIYRNGKVIFTSIIPTDNPCDFGGESWLMELTALNGTRLPYAVFDLNGDGGFTEQDYVYYTPPGGGGNNNNSTKVAASGIKSEVGLAPAPAILSDGDTEHKYLPGTSGNIQHITENPGSQAFGRQSWRQLK